MSPTVVLRGTPGKVARIAAALDLYIDQCVREGDLIEAKFAMGDRDTIRNWLLINQDPS